MKDDVIQDLEKRKQEPNTVTYSSDESVSTREQECESAIGQEKLPISLEDPRLFVNALMEHIPDIIYFKDKKSRFLRVNKAWAKKWGVGSPQEVIGKTDHDVFSKELANQTRADELEIMKSGRPMVGKEEKITWPDRSETWVSTTKAPMFDHNGRIIGIFGISRDITKKKKDDMERQKLEGRMQHTQKLERLGLLSGGIAHDFNNLLMGILGNSSLALMELTPESPVWNNIKQIETIASQAAELTNQLLAYSGKSKFVVKSLNLKTLVKEIKDLIVVSVSKKLKLAYNFSDNLPPIEGDPAQVRQVVMNLITNASDAMGNKKGTITVNIGAMNCDHAYLTDCYIGDNQSPGQYVFIEVTDTGYGMDAQTQEKIFDPFFTTKVKGRGLGLAAVLGIMRSHKGALRVSSEVHRGTTFKALFPRSAKEFQETESREEKKSTWHGSGAVLIVDDDEVVLTVTSQIFMQLGFTVHTVNTGISAIKQFKKYSDKMVVVLLDMTLPDIPGEKMLQKLRQTRNNIPIVLMSGYDEQSVTENVNPDHFAGFLQKPFKTETLVNILQEVLKEKEN